MNKCYGEILKEQDSLSILKQILTKKLNDEHILAKCFIVVHDLPDREVALFLSEEIWHSLQVLCNIDLGELKFAHLWCCVVTKNCFYNIQEFYLGKYTVPGFSLIL